MEMYKWDPWWENDWPVSKISKAQPNETKGAPVAIDENHTEYVIKIRVAEFQKEEINVNVDHGILKILGEHDEDKSTGYCGSFGVKPCQCSICRSFSLPEKIDASGIRATMGDGWLKLAIPKANSANNQKIDVVVH